MEFTRRHFIGASLAASASVSLASCVAPSRAPVATAPPAPVPGPAPAPVAAAPRRELPPLIAEAMAALEAHVGQVPYRDRIGVVDFSLPSSEPRFHLVDAGSGRIERSWLVAHGSGSDPAATGMLRRFSNEPGSNASSRGSYLTSNAYVGQHGRSRRLIGLDPTNDRALERAIVIHGAWYVDPAMVATLGRIGRSQGCLAVEQGEIAAVMDSLGEGRLIHAGKLA